jgi:arylsulfatase A-like enzyme
VRPGAWLVLALCLGLASGFADVGFQAARHFFLHHWVRLSAHALWMAPLAQTLFLGIIGVVAALAWRLRPQRGTALAILGALTGLAMLPVALAQPYLDWRAACLLIAGLSIQAARLALRRIGPVLHVARRALPALTALLLLAPAGVSLGLAWRERRLLGRHASPTGHPNILLIILDTVRAASLSAFGYERPTTPYLERFSRESARFDRAYSVSSWTLPSHASMFTGRWPHEVSADWNLPLDQQFPTLAEVFRDEGYATAGFVSNYFYTMPETGLSRGFIRYSTFPISSAEVLASWSLGSWVSNRQSVRRLVRSQELLNRKRADGVRRELLGWVDGLKGRPFFAMLNIFDAHQPYLPPAPYDTLFGDGRIGFHPKTKLTHRDVALGAEARKTLSLDEVARQHLAYDGAIRFIDSQLELLLEELRRRGVLDGTVVVITADHGEGLGEGGGFEHGNLFTDLTTHVPLLVRYPAVVPAGSVISPEVSLRDLAATLIALAQLPVRPDPLPGASLLQLLTASQRASQPISPAIASYWPWTLNGARRWSLVRNGWRYIVNEKGAEAVFDLRRDAYETDNLLSGVGRDTARAFRAVIDSVRRVTIASPRPRP